jgi:uncharacterized protein
MNVIETLLINRPNDARVTDIYVGANWVLALVSKADGTQCAGLASTPAQIASTSFLQVGHHHIDDNFQNIARVLRHARDVRAAVALSAINALNQPDESLLSNVDAADWLSAQSIDKNVAIFGRFPFIEDEIRPHARQVWVFEQEPQADELNVREMASVLPQADIVAITSSTIINRTIDSILSHTKSDSAIVLLGPSTPLVSKLFDCGIDALFGVRVADLEQVVASVMAGEGFQKLQGLKRVSMFKQR